jgi:hypothetical protein
MTSQPEQTADSPRRLEVSVGNEAFPPGRTEVSVDASGRVQAMVRLEGGDGPRAEAKLEPARAAAMIEDTGRAAATVREGKRYGLPDEPRYHFEVDDGRERRSVDVWRSELREHQELYRVVRTLQRVVDEYGKGEIIL